MAAVAAAQGQRATVRLEERRTADSQPSVTFPRVDLSLTRQRPPGLEGVGKLSDAARYSVVKLGAVELLLAFDSEGGALALGLLYTGVGKPAIGRARADGQGGLLVDFKDVAAPLVHIDVRLRYRGLEVASAVLQPSRHRHGRAAIGGVMRDVILVDADGDGRYGKRDRWVALRPARAKRSRTLRKADAMLLTEPQIPFEPDGRALTVENVAVDGSALDLVLDQPRMTVNEVLERRYDEIRADYYRQFAAERKAFAKHNGLDERRPRVKSPARWSSVPLSVAKAEASKAGKPLLVFYFTESNPWCFRYGYSTFPDAEVDALLRRFVLARIDVAKDTENSYVTSGARGTPCLLPLKADGKGILFRVRLREASGKVTDLKQKEKMITGWQRPQELVLNLKRILKESG